MFEVKILVTNGILLHVSAMDLLYKGLLSILK